MYYKAIKSTHGQKLLLTSNTDHLNFSWLYVALPSRSNEMRMGFLWFLETGKYLLLVKIWKHYLFSLIWYSYQINAWSKLSFVDKSIERKTSWILKMDNFSSMHFLEKRLISFLRRLFRHYVCQIRMFQSLSVTEIWSIV